MVFVTEHQTPADAYKQIEDRTIKAGAMSVCSSTQLDHGELAALAHIYVKVTALLTR